MSEIVERAMSVKFAVLVIAVAVSCVWIPIYKAWVKILCSAPALKREGDSIG